jgi:carbon monoxide dehydrogenase subunit G
MILTNEFPVEAPVCRVWLLLSELENVVPCMPGAAYHGRDGDDHEVSMKVKIGAINSHFKGTARFIERDEATHTAVVRGVGKDHGGKGSAAATVTARLEPLSAERTRVIIKTDLSMTGRLAQFGSGVISDIAALLISQFTDNLHRKVIARPGVSESPAATIAASPKGSARGVQAQEQTAVDLGPVVGFVALKYALKWIVMPLGFLFLGWLIGRYY